MESPVLVGNYFLRDQHTSIYVHGVLQVNMASIQLHIYARCPTGQRGINTTPYTMYMYGVLQVNLKDGFRIRALLYVNTSSCNYYCSSCALFRVLVSIRKALGLDSTDGVVFCVT